MVRDHSRREFYSRISLKLLRFPTEDIDEICSQESTLKFSSISSVKILSIFQFIIVPIELEQKNTSDVIEAAKDIARLGNDLDALASQIAEVRFKAMAF